MVGVTVYVGINPLPGEGTAKRVSIWKGVDQSGWMVEVRGGTAYLSFAEVQVFGIESEVYYNLQDIFGRAGTNGRLVSLIDNDHIENVCFHSYIKLTADVVCQALGYGSQNETKPVPGINMKPKVGEAYITGLNCFLTTSLFHCYYNLAEVCEEGGTYISCSCTEKQYWYNDFCAYCPGDSNSSTDRKTCICPSGQYFDSMRFSCRPCPAGTYIQSSNCLKCPVGYDSLPGSGKCRCMAGTYTLEDGTCEPCPENSYSNLTSIACLQCPGNTKSNLYQSTCSCLPGMYWESGYCNICPENTYSKYNSTECTTCTSGSGKNEGINCNCEAGYYWNNSTCEACQEGYFSHSGYLFCFPCPNVYDPGFKEHCPEKLNIRNYLEISAYILMVGSLLIALFLSCWYTKIRIQASRGEINQSITLVET